MSGTGWCSHTVLTSERTAATHCVLDIIAWVMGKPMSSMVQARSHVMSSCRTVLASAPVSFVLWAVNMLLLAAAVLLDEARASGAEAVGGIDADAVMTGGERVVVACLSAAIVSVDACMCESSAWAPP